MKEVNNPTLTDISRFRSLVSKIKVTDEERHTSIAWEQGEFRVVTTEPEIAQQVLSCGVLPLKVRVGYGTAMITYRASDMPSVGAALPVPKRVVGKFTPRSA